MGFSKYHLVKKALEACGYQLQKYHGGYKGYRYDTTFKYHIIDIKTDKVVVRYATITQIFDWLVKQGVIEITEEE